jgi:hypothetical protein
VPVGSLVGTVSKKHTSSKDKEGFLIKLRLMSSTVVEYVSSSFVKFVETADFAVAHAASLWTICRAVGCDDPRCGVPRNIMPVVIS